VEDDRDHRKQQQQVNEKACGVKDNKAANPSKKQHQRNNEKHGNLFRRRVPAILPAAFGMTALNQGLLAD
jgi:hypothetical protein